MPDGEVRFGCAKTHTVHSRKAPATTPNTFNNHTGVGRIKKRGNRYLFWKTGKDHGRSTMPPPLHRAREPDCYPRYQLGGQKTYWASRTTYDLRFGLASFEPGPNRKWQLKWSQYHNKRPDPGRQAFLCLDRENLT